ncbi:MAG: PAS domain S-box protein [Rhodocyclaceae bacterium]|nr:PAS domain S-box protein [Rhodocyclaceae bacterium]
MSRKSEGQQLSGSHLRASAEAQLKSVPTPAASGSPQELLHELQVHQIELEMQNEELRRTQIALEESRDRYVDLYEFAPIGYLTLSDKGLITQANMTVADLLGVARGKLLQRRFSTLVAPEDRDRFHRLFVSGMQHENRQAYDLKLVRGDGSIFPAHLDCLSVAAAGAAPVKRVTLTDISELKLAEAAILKLNETLAASNQELESFSYSVSHDLRAPLRALNGFSQVLAEDYADKLDEGGLHYLGRIRAASERMGILIDDMIDLARISRQELHRVEVNLSTLAEEILAELQEHQPLRAVSWSVSPNLLVSADPVLMKALLGNLLHNAWKFTAECPEARIEFGRALTADGAAFYVRDNGAGFDMTFADKLFKPFQRLHGVERFEGTGIGLAISLRIVRRHGGRVWAEGSPGQGATFWFTL